MLIKYKLYTSYIFILSCMWFRKIYDKAQVYIMFHKLIPTLFDVVCDYDTK